MKIKNVEDIYPLSPLQQGILFHTIEAPESAVYFEQYTCVIQGDLDVSAFKEAWTAVVDRHPVLRSAFIWEGVDRPLQVVRQRVEIPWTEEDWRDDPEPRQATRLETFLAAERARGFDPVKAPLLRMALFRSSRESYHFVWSFSHILIDGWSRPIVLEDVFTTYEALREGAPPDRPRPRPFREYIAWLQGQDLAAAESFWRDRLAGFEAPTPLPGRRAIVRSAARGEHHDTQSLELSSALTAALRDWARENRLTPSTLLFGAWALLLGRHGGQSDVVFGATVAGRPTDLPGAEGMVGVFFNTLPVRVRVSSEEMTSRWLHEIQAEQVAAREHEHSPLVAVQGWSDVPRGVPLFESIVVFENIDEAIGSWLRSAELRDVRHLARSNYPLALIVIPGERLELLLVHDVRRFDRPLISRLLEELKIVLERMIARPEPRLSALSLLTDDERHRLLVEWNRTDASIPTDRCWHELFLERVGAGAGGVAVVCGDRRLTYEQLDRKSNQLARHLQSLGIEPGSRVGICAERSVDVIVAILGVLRAGGAYVPLDPAQPRDRLGFILEDSGVSVLLAHHRLVSKLPTADVPVVCLDADRSTIDRESEETPTSSVAPGDLAYVIYTSGSTGQPKGVPVTHANLTHSTGARVLYYEQPVRAFLLLSSFSFDSSVAGIFWTLSQGGALCIPEEEQHRDVDYLRRLIEKQAISHLLCAPSLHQHLLAAGAESLRSLETVITAGEVCPVRLVERHRERLPGTALFNEYGPTEGTVWSTVFDCSSGSLEGTVPIGKPIPNTRVYVLDEHGQPAPVGAPGELHVGGAGVARGYLNRPELTRERFIDAPFEEAKGDRLYRTGDIVRYRADGNLEYLGRNDDQVKIRGYRIELGEVESSLRRHPGVCDAVVIAPPGENGTTPRRPGPDRPEESDSPEDLERSLTSLDSNTVERILAEVESLSGETLHAALELEKPNGRNAPESSKPDVRSGEATVEGTRRVKSHPKFELTLRFKSEALVKTPREAQRSWLISQLLAEMEDDLLHLDDVARAMVGGAPDFDGVFRDISRASLSEQEIMEDWQLPIMKAMARHVTESHGDVLEIGFGRGTSATFIQELGVRSHTIVEANELTIQNHFEPWRERFPDPRVRLIAGKWQDVLDRLSVYDGVFFHAVPLDEDEFIRNMLNGITFAEHFFPFAAERLRKGGTFTYLTTEIDSMSRRHQRALFKHFSSLTLSVEPLSVPSDTKDAWWVNSMVIVKAVK